MTAHPRTIPDLAARDTSQALILCFGAGGECRSALIHRDPHLGIAWMPRTQLLDAYGWGKTEAGYPLCSACLAEARGVDEVTS